MNLIKYINESMLMDDVNSLINNAIRRSGTGFKVKKGTGHTVYTLENGKKIVWDGVGIDVKENGKSIKYLSGKPKLEYKEAVNFATE